LGVEELASTTRTSACERNSGKRKTFLLQDPQPATRDEVEELFRCMNLSLDRDLESKMNRIAEIGKKLFL
jgi:hypothetical protein